MRERHADTVRFHKSHRPKMTVVRLVIGLLLLVFPSQLTAVGENVEFSYVIDFRNESYAKINFYRTSTSDTPISEYPVSDSPVYLGIETNMTDAKVTMEASAFTCDKFPNIVFDDFTFTLEKLEESDDDDFPITSSKLEGEKPQTIIINKYGTGSIDEEIFVVSFSIGSTSSLPATTFTSTFTVTVQKDQV